MRDVIDKQSPFLPSLSHCAVGVHFAIWILSSIAILAKLKK